jgi:hypothetical protein
MNLRPGKGREKKEKKRKKRARKKNKMSERRGEGVHVARRPRRKKRDDSQADKALANLCP